MTQKKRTLSLKITPEIEAKLEKIAPDMLRKKKKREKAERNQKAADERARLESLKAEKKRITVLDEMVEYLSERFPKAFSSTNPKPLKVRIHKDLEKLFEEENIYAEKGWTKMHLRHLLPYYTRNEAYLKATIEQNHRVDLKGNPQEEVTEKNKEYAKGALEHLKTNPAWRTSPPFKWKKKGKNKEL